MRRAALITAIAMTMALPATADPLDVPVQVETLANGLRVVLSPDHRVPTVGIAVYYDVGSRLEEHGRSGFAHLFEHMMFEGSVSVPKGDHSSMISRYGGDDNAFTTEDVTAYHESLPGYALELGLWLEADRMRALDVTPEKLENQLHAVSDEYDQSFTNAPYGLSTVKLDAIAYEGYWPYEHSVIGDMTELSHAVFTDVRAFHSKYYSPDNAVISIAGDLDPVATMALVRKHFDAIPRSGTTAWVDPGFTMPEHERKESMTDGLIDHPAFYMSYHVPARRTPDHYALELLARILSDGESSRLHRALVVDREVASDVSVDLGDRRGPDLFTIFCVLTGRRGAESVRSQIDDILHEMTRRITRTELDRALNRLRADTLFELQSNLSRAEALAMYEIADGNAALLRTELDRYESVRIEDIRRVTQQYLVPEHRVILDVVPAP